MKLDAENEYGFKLHLEIPDTIAREDVPVEVAQMICEDAYQKSFNAINDFLTLAIAFHDFESLDIVMKTIHMIANKRKEQIEGKYKNIKVE